MTTFDLSPLFRTAIGFDRLTDALESARHVDTSGYPPYNIERVDENRYRITMAVAGFSQNELEIEVKENKLKINGRKVDDGSSREYLYRGIANRSFERIYQLADYVRVDGAEVKDGLLHIALVREVPEAMKPRRIPIDTAEEKLVVDQKTPQAA